MQVGGANSQDCVESLLVEQKQHDQQKLALEMGLWQVREEEVEQVEAQAKVKQLPQATKWVAQAKDFQLRRAQGVDQKEEREESKDPYGRSQRVARPEYPHGGSKTSARPEDPHGRSQTLPCLPFLLHVHDLSCARDLLGSASRHHGSGHLQVRTHLAGPSRTDVSARPQHVVLVSLFASQT